MTIRDTAQLPDFSDTMGSSRFLLLTTLGLDGTPVPTPVCFVTQDGRLVVWTAPESGKVRRIRRTPRVLVSTCDRTGRPTSRTSAGTAVVLGAPEDPAEDLRRRKYGWLWHLPRAYRAVRGLFDRDSRGPLVRIAIALDPPPAGDHRS